MKENKQKLTSLAAKAALILVAILWGSSLVVAKSSVESISPSLLIAMRFAIACVLLSVIFVRRLRIITRDDLLGGAIIGLFLFGAYWIQTLGITLAMPGKSGFLSSVYCVMVPFTTWLMCRVRPCGRNVAAAVLCVAGIALASVTEGFSIEPGDMLALLSGVFYALHITSVRKYGQGRDPIVMTILQFGFCALYALAATWIVDGAHPLFSPDAFGSVLYLALFCTAAALLLQNVAQKVTEPSSASIFLSTESIWSVFFSVWVYGEQVTPRMWIGFAMIFAAVLISERGGVKGVRLRAISVLPTMRRAIGGSNCRR